MQGLITKFHFHPKTVEGSKNILILSVFQYASLLTVYFRECPGWSGTHYVAQTDPDLQVLLLPQLLECWVTDICHHPVWIWFFIASILLVLERNLV